MTGANSALTQQEELDMITTSIPAVIGNRIAGGVAEIKAAGVALGLVVGDQAPDFTLLDAVGESVTLSELLANGPVVLTFYRGEWCPYCNVQLRHLEQALPSFSKVPTQPWSP